MTNELLATERSATNTAIVQAALDLRGCNCVPYETVLTYQGWKKIQCQVMKGEKSLARVPTFRRAKVEGSDITKTWPAVAFMFCACQVESMVD